MASHFTARISMQDIAKAVGVSRNTVSLAFRNHKKISQKTRDKILKAADEMGYSYDAKIVELTSYLAKSKRKSGIKEEIAYLHMLEPSKDPRKPSHIDFFAPLAQQAEFLGYRVVPYKVGRDGYNAHQLERIFKQRGIRGLFLAPTKRGPYPISLNWEQYSILAFGNSVTEPAFDQLNWDFTRATTTCLKRLYEMGYDRIAVIAPYSFDRDLAYTIRMATYNFYSFLPKKLRLPIIDDDIVSNPDKRYDFLDKWLKKNKPEAVVSFQDKLSDIRHMGYRVPEDLAFASFRVDNKDLANNTCTGVLPSSAEMGRISAELMTTHILHNRRGISRTRSVILVDGKWQEGNTARMVASRLLPKALAD